MRDASTRGKRSSASVRKVSSETARNVRISTNVRSTKATAVALTSAITALEMSLALAIRDLSWIATLIIASMWMSARREITNVPTLASTLSEVTSAGAEKDTTLTRIRRHADMGRVRVSIVNIRVTHRGSAPASKATNYILTARDVSDCVLTEMEDASTTVAIVPKGRSAFATTTTLSMKTAKHAGPRVASTTADATVAVRTPTKGSAAIVRAVINCIRTGDPVSMWTSVSETEEDAPITAPTTGARSSATATRVSNWELMRRHAATLTSVL